MKKGEQHPFHKTIGRCIINDVLPGCEIMMDPACDEHAGNNIPLFMKISSPKTDSGSTRISENYQKSNRTEMCNVDILIIKDNVIRVIIEIEESNIKPIQICGKFLTSALSGYYSCGDECYFMGDSVSFLQVLDSSKLENKSSKPEQWKNLEKAIKDKLPINNIKNYNLIYGKEVEIKNKITNWLNHVLKN